METVPLADRPCHRAGIPKNDSGGGVYPSRWPPSVTTVVQQLPNANDPVVLPPPCQAPSTSTAETGRPLHSQRMANDPVALPSLRAAPALSTDEQVQPLHSQRSPSAFLPCAHGHPLVLPQLLLPARRKKVSPRCRHFHGCGPPLPNVHIRSEPAASTRLCASTLPQIQAFVGVGAEVDESRPVHGDVSAGLSTEEQSTTRRGTASRPVANRKKRLSACRHRTAATSA
nr:uncharacterized protein LOC126529003 isoform X1 [Dermacentor andersoni]